MAEALGDLPLALEQASAYIEAIRIFWSNYLDLFRQFSLPSRTSPTQLKLRQWSRAVASTPSGQSRNF